MSDAYRLWCFVEGDDVLFSVVVSSAEPISELKYLIKEKKRISLKGLDPSGLTLWKVRYF
jgi:Crinkler effector protein N-terminal domain